MTCPEIPPVTLLSQTTVIAVIAILTSAITAITVVFLTQWFLSCRAERELIIKKVEELFLASAEYAKCCTNLLIWVQENEPLWVQENEPHDSNADSDILHLLTLELTDSINKMDMICGLYFKGQSFSINEYLINNMPIIEMVKNKTNIPKDKWVNAFNDSKDHIGASRSKLHKLCKALMESYGY